MRSENSLFLALQATAVVWLAGCFLLLARIKSKHPSIFEAWGSPTLTNISPELLPRAFSLLLTGSHKDAGDNLLTTIIYVLRVIGTVFAALLISFVYALGIG